MADNDDGHVDRLEEVEDRIQELEEAKEDGPVAGHVPDQLEARQEEREELVQQDEEERQVDRRSPGERREDGDDPRDGAKQILVEEDPDADPQEFGQETVGTGDTEEEAVLDAARRGTDIDRAREAFDLSETDIQREQRRQLEQGEDQITEQISEIQERGEDEVFEVDPDIAEEVREHRDIDTQIGDESLISGEALVDFLQTEQEELETGLQQIDRREQIREQQEQQRQEFTDRLEDRTAFDFSNRDQIFQDRFQTDNLQQFDRPELGLADERITDDELTQMHPEGTIIDDGISDEMIISDPEIREGISDSLRQSLGGPGGWEALTADIIGDDEAQQEALEDMPEAEEITPTDFVTSPLGTTASAPVGGAGIGAVLRTMGPRAQAAATTGLTSLTALEAHRADQEVSELQEEGEESRAAGRGLRTAAEIGGFTGGAAGATRRLSPRLGDTRITDTDTRLTETDAGTLIGRGHAEGQTNVIHPRLLRRDRTEELEGEADFLAQITDQGATTAGRLTQEQPRRRATDDVELDEEDFFATARPFMQRDDDDLLVTRDRIQTGEDTEFGFTRLREQDRDTVDRIDRVKDDGLRQTIEGPFEQVDTTSVSRLDDTPGTTLGTGRTLIDRTRFDTETRPADQTTRRGTDEDGFTRPGDGEQQQEVDFEQIQEGLEGFPGVTQQDAAQALRTQIDTSPDTPRPGTTAPLAQETETDDIGEFEAGRDPVAFEQELIEEARQEEEQLMETQQDTFDTAEEGIVGSPTIETEEFAREPVTDRLMQDVPQIDVLEQPETQEPQVEQEIEQETITQPVDPFEQIPETTQQRMDQQLEEVDPFATPLTRESPSMMQEDELTADFTTQQRTELPEQVERPLEEGVLGLTRTQTPAVRQVQQTPARSLLGMDPAVTDPMAPTRSAGPRAFGAPGLGLPSIGTGFQETGPSTVEQPFETEESAEFAPDLTGLVFGETVTPEEAEQQLETGFTGLETRGLIVEDDEDDLPGTGLF